MEKSHILKSLFIHLYVSPTNSDTETFFGQNNLFHTVAASIFDSIFLMSSHAVPGGRRIKTITKSVVNAIAWGDTYQRILLMRDPRVKVQQLVREVEWVNYGRLNPEGVMKG